MEKEMKSLYLDLSRGATKEGLCAALYDVLSDEKKDRFSRDFGGLGIEGVSFECTNSVSLHIRIDGLTEAEHKKLHHHEHVHRGMADIKNTVSAFKGISDKVKKDILGIYGIIAAAEAEVHASTPDNVHFHEVGGMYAIASVTAFAMLMDLTGAEEVYASPARTGKGMIECAHGLLPVPAPATAVILRGIPNYAGDEEGEFTTPTGAAIVKYYVKEFKS